MRRRIKKGDNCLNCGRELHDENFCPDCGQLNNIAKPTFGQLIMDALANLFAFDSKFYLSIWPLMRHPGSLSLEFANGRKSTYLPPIRLFLLVMIITLGLNSLNNRIERGFTNSSHLKKENKKVDRLADIANADSVIADGALDGLNLPIADSSDTFNMQRMLQYAIEHPEVETDSALIALGIPVNATNRKYYDQLAENSEELAKLPLFSKKSDTGSPNVNVSFSDSKTGSKLERMFKYASANPDTSTEEALRELNYPNTFWNSFFYDYMLKLALMSFTDFLNYIKSNLLVILLLFVPIMALVLKALYFYKKEYYYVDHFTFSIHTQTAFFVLVALSILLDMLFGTSGYFLVLLVFPIYFFIGLKNFYKQGRLLTLVNYLIINTSFFFVAGIFLFLVGLVSFLLI